MRTPFALAILVLASWGMVTAGSAHGAEEACASCHEEAKKIQASAHASLECSSCHEKHESYPHPAGVPKPECAQCHAEQAGDHALSVHGQELKKGNSAAPTCSICHGSAHELKTTSSPDFHKGVPDTCGMCHTEIAEQFKASVHGKAVAAGNVAAPICTDCHGEHSILRPSSAASTVNAQHIRETCAHCHGDVSLARKFGLPSDRIVSFDQSFHGLAAKSGSQSVANCASCHGFHNILPSSDPKANTNQKNLPKTCGHCHPGAGQRFALGPVHLTQGKAETDAMKWVRIAYSIIIPLTIGLMLLHNFGDWLRKLLHRRVGRTARDFGPVNPLANGSGEIRMYPFERFQHALLAGSFIVLAWTGFALKYPDQWWARPLVMWETQWPVRGTVHRIAAVLFTLGSLIHVISLIVSRKLRRHWKEMIPTRSDVPEAFGNFMYNLGLMNQRPPVSSHSYIEKAEYWAVIWGGVVMFLTGVILWANNLALSWLPKNVSDVATAIHLYEAILATLAIVVWHFYSVMFDPDVYPMDTGWLTGRSVKYHPHGSEEEPRDAESEGHKRPDLVEDNT
jgi:formate dehydrogenase gamma subunit